MQYQRVASEFRRIVEVVFGLTLALPALAMPPESVYLTTWLRSNQAIASATDLEPWGPTSEHPEYPATRVVFGDSILAKMNTARLGDHVFNDAVSTNTAPALCRRVSHYRRASRLSAGALVHIGTNDATQILVGLWTARDTKDAFDCIGKNILVPFKWAAILHVTSDFVAGKPGQPLQSYTAAQKNAVIDDLNVYAQGVCGALARCTWVPSPIDDRPELLRDGLHPNQAGYDLLAPGWVLP
jgi:lysophospholipase L1-like esterase